MPPTNDESNNQPPVAPGPNPSGNDETMPTGDSTPAADTPATDDFSAPAADSAPSPMSDPAPNGDSFGADSGMDNPAPVEPVAAEPPSFETPVSTDPTPAEAPADESTSSVGSGDFNGNAGANPISDFKPQAAPTTEASPIVPPSAPTMSTHDTAKPAVGPANNMKVILIIVAGVIVLAVLGYFAYTVFVK